LTGSRRGDGERRRIEPHESREEGDVFGRITHIEGAPDQIDQGTEYVRQTILPAARQLDGFRGVLSLADRAAGKAMTITLWETEEAMRASEEAANRMRDDAATALGARIAGVERYEVTISEVPATASV
jgi:heme-degrading monooxygenase HmoA